MAKDVFNKAVAKLRKEIFGEDIVSDKFEDVTLADNSVIKVEPALEVGAKATIEDSNGVVTPVEDGTYELLDKRNIVIVGGAIESIENPVKEGMSDTITGNEVSKMIQAIESLFSKKYSILENKFKAFKKETELKSKKTNEAFMNAFEELGKEPNEETPQNKSGLIVGKNGKFKKK